MFVCVCVPTTEDELKNELKQKSLDEVMDDTGVCCCCGACYDYAKKLEERQQKNGNEKIA